MEEKPKSKDSFTKRKGFLAKWGTRHTMHAYLVKHAPWAYLLYVAWIIAIALLLDFFF